MKVRKFGTMVVALSMLVVSSLGVVGFAGAAPSTGENQIMVNTQDASNGQVTVESVAAAQDGWLLIRKDANGMPGAVIGFAAVRQGLNSRVKVNIKSRNSNGDDSLTATLWATLVADQHARDAYAFPDTFVEQFGSQAMAAFGNTTALTMAGALPTTGGSALGANRITVYDQNTDQGRVFVDSAMAAQDGWLLIRKDANGAFGGVIGYARVHQGLNPNLYVDIKSIGSNGKGLTPTLWATLAADHNSRNAYSSPDSQIEQMNSQAVVAFGSTAASTAAATSAVAMQVPTFGGVSTSRIAVRAQDTSNGQVIVDSAIAAQNGWLLIRKDAKGMPGQTIGFTRVHQGLNTGLSVDIKSTNRNGDDNTTPTLYATLVADQNAQDAYATPDVTSEQYPSLAMATFGSTAQ